MIDGRLHMHNTITDPWMKLKCYLNQEDYDLVKALQAECLREEQISLKLELDYKLAVAANRAEKPEDRPMNEFMAFDGEKLIGYIGICGFGGASMPLEITGMVHPEYRRQGVFSALHALVLAECKRRNAAALWLCDKSSAAGQAFIKHIGAKYKSSEFEMVFRGDVLPVREDQLQGIRFRKATNADAGEVARQNKIYFSDSAEAQQEDNGPLPEEEEKRGMTIYLAEKGSRPVGKVNLEFINGIGGIYGLGVLPEYRGLGYGRAILLMSLQRLKDAHQIGLQVSAVNARALGLYKSCGFEETSVMDYFAV